MKLISLHTIILALVLCAKLAQAGKSTRQYMPTKEEIAKVPRRPSLPPPDYGDDDEDLAETKTTYHPGFGPPEAETTKSATTTTIKGPASTPTNITTIKAPAGPSTTTTIRPRVTYASHKLRPIKIRSDDFLTPQYQRVTVAAAHDPEAYQPPADPWNITSLAIFLTIVVCSLIMLAIFGLIVLALAGNRSKVEDELHTKPYTIYDSHVRF